MEKLVTFLASPESNARLRKWLVVVGFVGPTSILVCMAVIFVTDILKR